jgi:hypothetical protein
MKNFLKTIYTYSKKNIKLVLITFILLFTFILLSEQVKVIFVTIIFIILASLSKIYHRFFKSTIGIDLILFLTLIISYRYNNPLLSFFVGYISLILADLIGSKISHTSVVSLISLTFVILLSRILFLFDLVPTFIFLTILFEIITIFLYKYVLSSSLPRILTYLFSHFIFNMILILNFTELIINII